MNHSDDRLAVCQGLAAELVGAHDRYRERKDAAERQVEKWEWFTRSPLDLPPFNHVRLELSGRGRRLRRPPPDPTNYTEVGLDVAGTIWCQRWYQPRGWHYETFVSWGEPYVDEWLYSYNWLIPRPCDEDFVERPAETRPAFWVRRQHRKSGRPVWTARVSKEAFEWEEYSYDAQGRVSEIRLWLRIELGVRRGEETESVQRPQYEGESLVRIACYEAGSFTGELLPTGRPRRERNRRAPDR